MKSNISTFNQGPQVNLNKNLIWCTPDFLPNFNGNKGFTTNRKTMSEMISGTEPGETSRLKSFVFGHFIAYAPDKSNSSSAIKKPGTNKHIILFILVVVIQEKFYVKIIKTK